jgi:hypothetical protein
MKDKILNLLLVFIATLLVLNLFNKNPETINK